MIAKRLAPSCDMASVPADRLLPCNLAPDSNGRERRFVLSWLADRTGRMRVQA
jgi:hypothetical protein